MERLSCKLSQAPTPRAEAGRTFAVVEHGLSPDIGVRKWQNRLDPLWTRITGGCHMNRPIQSLIESAGFQIDRLSLGYAPGPKPLTYFYEGSAKPN